MVKMEKVAVATATAVALQAGPSLVRGILGGLFKRR
jgi:hypothetical protein